MGRGPGGRAVGLGVGHGQERERGGILGRKLARCGRVYFVEVLRRRKRKRQTERESERERKRDREIRVERERD